ncbi:hypothetical protein HKBW3S42_02383, partial [Candidatus Hakubella thermalkaliphila]
FAANLGEHTNAMRIRHLIMMAAQYCQPPMIA